MTAALEGGEWSAARPGRTLPPGKTRYPFYRRLGGHQGQSGWAENLVSTGIRFRAVQPVFGCSSLCNLLHSPVTSSLLGPNILLNTMFSITLRGGNLPFA